MSRMWLIVLALALGVSLPAGAAPTALPVEGEPDVVPVGAPAATVEIFDGERFTFTEGRRDSSFDVPNLAWDRAILTVTGVPHGDPWDRLLGVAIGGTEVLRATTPRASFTLRRDVTRYSALLVPGAQTTASIYSGSWVGGGWEYTVTLDLYMNEPTAGLVAPAASRVTPVQLFTSLSCHGDERAASVTFPGGAPAGADLEITISGHGQDGEFWYLNGGRRPRTFHVFLDDVEIGQAVAMPFVYALAGIDGPLGNDVLHPIVWWSAFQVLDIAGAHWGVGEVPAYRARIEAEHLPLLTGLRTIKVVQENGTARTASGKCLSDANWFTSLSIVSD